MRPSKKRSLSLNDKCSEHIIPIACKLLCAYSANPSTKSASIERYIRAHYNFNESELPDIIYAVSQYITYWYHIVID